MVRGARSGNWRRPAWFGHATWVFFCLTAGTWLWGSFSGGLDMEEACRFQHGQPYDEAYYEAHRADYFRLFPLTRRCHATYDMVPAWVNPAVVGCGLLLATSAAGVLWARKHQAGSRTAHEGGTS
ncbi:MAG TPA: hypothetical protein VFY17_03385 [Pilimelia sp.]|nr:hypothetical protein [Pilimelia sp.]